MPILRGEFEKGLTADALSERVRQLFARNPETAYTALEVAEGVGMFRGSGNLTLDVLSGWAALVRVEPVLEDLEKKGVIASRDVEVKDGRTERYYILKKR